MHVPFPRVVAMAALALAIGVAPSLPRAVAGEAVDPPPNVVYDVQIPLAPVLLEGTYPLRLEIPGQFLDGSLTVDTDDRGVLSGTYRLGATILDVSGRVKHRPTGSTIHLSMKTLGEKITLDGELTPDGFTGDTSGKGTIAPGKNTFTLDVSSAASAVAFITVVIEPGAKSTLSGDATVAVAATPLSGKAVRRAGKSLSLDVHAGAFKFTASGPVSADPQSITASWKAVGYGASTSGEGMALAVVPPPSGISFPDAAPLLEAEEISAPDVPTVGGGPVIQWSVDPALPAGLAVDPVTGVLSGTPALPAAAASYTVTASNLAGSAHATLSVEVRGNRAYSLAPEQRTLTDDDYRHFLMRTHFGVKASELASLEAAGLAASVDDMLVFTSGTAVETAANAEFANPAFPAGYEISRWWGRIMVDTDRPFQEVMAFFWHDHMPVAWDVFDGGLTHFEVNYINLLRHQGSGNLRDLLLAVARDEGMLVYLSGYVNNKFAPNENFGREFWELFTLGVDDGYTQADIVQSAKALTGYQLKYNSGTGQYYMQFNPALHDAGSKSFFGATITGQNVNDDYADVVDITLARRPAAEFVSKKIFEYFCYEKPPQSVVDAMAATLRTPPAGYNAYDLKPLLKQLFTSEAFFSTRSRARRVKSPLEFAVGLSRSTGLKLTTATEDAYLSILGQDPGLPPTVNGWPLGTLWYAPDAMVNRANLAYTVVGDTTRQASAGINVANILPPAGPQRTDQTVLDTVSDLLRVDLTTSEHDALITYLNSQRQANGTITFSAFDGSSQAQLDERVRGLIYILAQHPDYQVK